MQNPESKFHAIIWNGTINHGVTRFLECTEDKYRACNEDDIMSHKIIQVITTLIPQTSLILDHILVKVYIDLHLTTFGKYWLISAPAVASTMGRLGA